MGDSNNRLMGLHGKLVLGMLLLAAGIAGRSVSAPEETSPDGPAEGASQAANGPIPALRSGAEARSDPLPFEVGEHLTYRVSWAETLEAGRAELRVTSRDSKGSGAYRLVLEASSTSAMASVYRLQFQCSSLFDADQGVSREYRESFKENGRTVRESLVFNHGGGTASYVNSRKESSQLTIELGTQDPVSGHLPSAKPGPEAGIAAAFPDCGRRGGLPSRCDGRRK